MITVWVKSNSTPHPRRTHRLGVWKTETDCGLRAIRMSPVTTSMIDKGDIPPMFCHVCFKYRYRFLSRPKNWRHQMQNIGLIRRSKDRV